MVLKAVQQCDCTYCHRTVHLKIVEMKFPGGPVLRTPYFHCWGPGQKTNNEIVEMVDFVFHRNYILKIDFHSNILKCAIYL